LVKGELGLGRLRWRALVREAEARELRVLIGSEDGCLEKKGERGIVMVVVSGLGAIDAEDEANKRQKTEMRERSDEAAIDG
jgi:hypothetical protein